MADARATMLGQLFRLKGIRHEQGHCYVCEVSEAPPGDTSEHPMRSRLEVIEDGRALGPGHVSHDSIRERGHGRYSHWHNALLFSTSDNTDPRYNRRTYQTCLHGGSDEGRRARLQAISLRAEEAMSVEEAFLLAETAFYELVPQAFIGADSKLCWEDAAFIADYRRLVGTNRKSFERKYTVAQLVKAVKDVPGDLAECGVYQGHTAFFMAQATVSVCRPRRLHLFDSFEGLSGPGAHDGSYWRAGNLSAPEEHARAALADIDDVAFYRGWIPDRFAEVADRQFAFVHIDVDLYQPTLDSLRFFYSRVPPKGILVCDDYGFLNTPGATAAMTSFMSDKPEHIVHLPTGQGVIIRA